MQYSNWDVRIVFLIDCLIENKICWNDIKEKVISMKESVPNLSLFGRNVLDKYHFEYHIILFFIFKGVFRRWWEKFSHRILKGKKQKEWNLRPNDSKISWLSPKFEEKNSLKRMLRSSSFSHTIPTIMEKKDLSIDNTSCLR